MTPAEKRKATIAAKKAAESTNIEPVNTIELASSKRPKFTIVKCQPAFAENLPRLAEKEIARLEEEGHEILSEEVAVGVMASWVCWYK